MKLKQALSEFGETLGGLTGMVLAVLIYGLIGLLLAAPYTYLASGTDDNLFWAIWMLPIIALILAFIYIARKGFGNLTFFWMVLGYVCLPIILNGLSIAFGWAGLERTSRAIFALRYLSLVLVPTLAILCGAVWEAIENWREKRQEGKPPPPLGPPSNEGGGQIREVSFQLKESSDSNNQSEHFRLAPA